MREEVRPGRREGAGWRRRNRRARGGPDSRLWGDRARAERTLNISRMFVTLDVSKLSGWLNASARCRVKGGHEMREEVRPGRPAGRASRGGDAIGSHGEGPTQGLGARARAERTAKIQVTAWTARCAGVPSRRA